MKKYANHGSSTGINTQQVIDDAVDFAVRMANDNSHGYSQSTRSLYNTANQMALSQMVKGYIELNVTYRTAGITGAGLSGTTSTGGSYMFSVGTV